MTAAHRKSTTRDRACRTEPSRTPGRRPEGRSGGFKRLGGLIGLGVLLGTLGGCGGGGNPLTNPPDVTNRQVIGGQTLSFDYYQQCINPIFEAALPIPGSSFTNTCAASGCHNTLNSSGGALRLIRGAALVTDFTAPDTVRNNADMYKNFISAKGVTVIGNPVQSRLIIKPRLLGSTFHGGGLIFDSDGDVNVQLFRYWISHPVPDGQDEFSTALTGAIVKDSTGKCIPQ